MSQVQDHDFPRPERDPHPSAPEIQASAKFKAVIAVGVSGAGQAQWAKEFAKSERAEGRKWLVLCRDDMRLDTLRDQGVPESDLPQAVKDWSYAFSNPAEAQVHGRWLGRARWAVEHGFDGVISADTNLDGGRSATSILHSRLGVDKANIIRKLFDASALDAAARDGASAFAVGPDEIAKQLHQLGRTLSLRKALDKAPLTAAWAKDPANGFQTPKSLLPRPPKADHQTTPRPSVSKRNAPSPGM